MRSFYSSDIKKFLEENVDHIITEMVVNNPFELNELQRNAWIEEIKILKQQLTFMDAGRILFEYTIPRMGKRVDTVILYKGIIFLLEFKVGDNQYLKSTFDQVLDYALDLKNFQQGCANCIIVPIAIPTKAESIPFDYSLFDDKVATPIGANKENLGLTIMQFCKKHRENDFDYESWENSIYMPTPTIIEAAQSLYNNHSVAEISRTDAGAYNLTKTTDAIKSIIDMSKKNQIKSIIFVTGVPGAGKTLVGLNLASEFHDNAQGEHAVFLSGNYPLVSVLQEALARDKIKSEHERGHRITKYSAKREVKSFIQIIHHYRDEYVGNDRKPTERVIIFDESQRAWTKDEIASFMQKKKNISGFKYSEPEFVISTMDRIEGWGVVICLVGGGQEINKGEAGMPEWFDSLQRSFPDWEVYMSSNIQDVEYLRDRKWNSLIEGLKIHLDESLHLSTSRRSFRSEKVAALVKRILDTDAEQAALIYAELGKKYPIFLTRDLQTAKKWVREKSRGSERYGLLASSNAARLKPYGVVYANDRTSISPENWFLNNSDDIRSSYFLEAVASEFETQGLELDYAIVAWDADFRMENGKWIAYQLSGRKTPPNWAVVRNENSKIYMTNAYRVLLTRARQGFIIYIPEGTNEDLTRVPMNYDETYAFFKKIGIKEL